jgi:hypothetical protein
MLEGSKKEAKRIPFRFKKSQNNFPSKRADHTVPNTVLSCTVYEEIISTFFLFWLTFRKKCAGYYVETRAVLNIEQWAWYGHNNVTMFVSLFLGKKCIKQHSTQRKLSLFSYLYYV